MAQFMINSDAFAWGKEHDPSLRSTIVTVILLDRAPDWDVVVDRFERIGYAAPMFRQRVAESLPRAPPRWEPDPDFDLGFHLRRVKAPHPGTLEPVLEMARLAEMAEFDHARPLWDTTLVEDLADGGAALICRLHHSLMDGIGGVQIAMLLFDVDREPRELDPLPPPPTSGSPGRLDGFRHWLEYDARLAGRLAREVLLGGPAALVGAVRRPLATARGHSRRPRRCTGRSGRSTRPAPR